MFLCSITKLATKTYTKSEERKRPCHLTKDILRKVDEAHYANKGKKQRSNKIVIVKGLFEPLKVEKKKC